MNGLNELMKYLKEDITTGSKFPRNVLFPKEKPLISIYTPTYKRNKILRERALASVLNQTYTNWEYIIVSDGINPDLRQIIASYDEPRIRYYEIERKEPSHDYDDEKAWFLSGTHPANFALDKVKGDWIARLDDDDIWSNDHIEKSLQFALNGNYEFVSSQYIMGKGRGGKVYHGIPIKDYIKEGHVETKVGGHSTFFYKASFKSIKYDPEAYKREWNRVDHANLIWQMHERGVKMGFLEAPTMIILPRPGETNIGIQAVKDKRDGYPFYIYKEGEEIK